MTTMFEPRMDPRRRTKTTPSKRKLRVKALLDLGLWYLELEEVK